MVGEFGRAVRHLVWAVAVIALGALAALGVALDAQGSGALAGIGLPGWIVAVIAIVAATVIAAGKLAEMSFKVERLERERDETTFREAPIISWTDVHAEYEPNNNIYVETWCENTGPTESVATYLSAAFVCRLHPEEELVIVSPLTRWHPIKSHKLGNEHKFKVQVVSQSPLSPGTHEIQVDRAVAEAERNKSWTIISLDVQDAPVAFWRWRRSRWRPSLAIRSYNDGFSAVAEHCCRGAGPRSRHPRRTAPPVASRWCRIAARGWRVVSSPPGAGRESLCG
jgi:hypothetical protein